MSTIHQSHCFALRSFPFLELLHEVPGVAWSRGRAGARRRRCVSDRGGAGKDQGTRMRPWVAVARPEMARGGPATRATAAADGDGPVRWRGSDLQRGARRLRRRQLDYSFLGRKNTQEREPRGNPATVVTHSSAFMATALARARGRHGGTAGSVDCSEAWQQW